MKAEKNVQIFPEKFGSSLGALSELVLALEEVQVLM